MKGKNMKVIMNLIVICLFIVTSVIFCGRKKSSIAPTKLSATGKLMPPKNGVYHGL